MEEFREEVALLEESEDYKCCVCGKKAIAVDFSFEGSFCCQECLDEMWKKFWKAESK